MAEMYAVVCVVTSLEFARVKLRGYNGKYATISEGAEKSPLHYKMLTGNIFMVRGYLECELE
jgi:hypothetical protein